MRGYDYSKSGWYFVTINAQQRMKLFLEETGTLNEIGEMIEYWWKEIPVHFQNIGLKEWTIMPDHLHGIVTISGLQEKKLGEIVRWFKTMTTNQYFKGIKMSGWPRIDRRLWQRNYYERIIRNEREYFNVKDYIVNNPNK